MIGKMTDVPQAVVTQGAVPEEQIRGYNRAERAARSNTLIDFYKKITGDGLLETKLSEAAKVNWEDVFNPAGPILRNKTKIMTETGEVEVDEVWQIKISNNDQKISLKLVTTGAKEEKTEELVVEHHPDEEGNPDSNFIYSVKDHKVESEGGKVIPIRPITISNNLTTYKANEALLVRFAKFINPPLATPPPITQTA